MNQVEWEDTLPLPPVESIDTPRLSESERAEFLRCINGVRSGRYTYEVLLSNHKETDTPPRIAGEDYDRHNALAPGGHLGRMLRAPTNQRGLVYVYVYDEGRALNGENGHTNVTMAGVSSFKVLSEHPGPLAQLHHGTGRDSEPEPQPQPFDPRSVVLMAQLMIAQGQGMVTQGQSMILMGQTILAQLPQLQPQPQR